jgi:hypothetical protein
MQPKTEQPDLSLMLMLVLWLGAVVALMVGIL